MCNMQGFLSISNLPLVHTDSVSDLRLMCFLEQWAVTARGITAKMRTSGGRIRGLIVFLAQHTPLRFPDQNTLHCHAPAGPSGLTV